MAAPKNMWSDDYKEYINSLSGLDKLKMSKRNMDGLAMMSITLSSSNIPYDMLSSSDDDNVVVFDNSNMFRHMNMNMDMDMAMDMDIRRFMNPVGSDSDTSRDDKQDMCVFHYGSSDEDNYQTKIVSFNVNSDISRSDTDTDLELLTDTDTDMDTEPDRQSESESENESESDNGKGNSWSYFGNMLNLLGRKNPLD